MYICENGGWPFDRTLLVIAEPELPYGLVSVLLWDARAEGYEDLELVILRVSRPPFDAPAFGLAEALHNSGRTPD